MIEKEKFNKGSSEHYAQSHDFTQEGVDYMDIYNEEENEV